MNNNIKIILGFTAGAAAGALTGLLMAPQSGKKTRKLISKESDKMRDTIGEIVSTSLDEAKKKYNETLDEYSRIGKKAVAEAKEKVKLN